MTDSKTIPTELLDTLLSGYQKPEDLIGKSMGSSLPLLIERQTLRVRSRVLSKLCWTGSIAKTANPAR
jgi:hypothetical protein